MKYGIPLLALFLLYHIYSCNMTARIPLLFIVITLFTASLTGCTVLDNSKHSFNDGIYQTKRFSKKSKVYVLKIDDDTLAVFPVKEFKDSTAIMTKDRVNYMGTQRKFKDGKAVHNFYRPSFDLDVMTIPFKYRPVTSILPNQLDANFTGAIYGGYRIDNYRVTYQRTPLNNYKQKVKHIGYSAGFFAGIGNSLIDEYSLTNHFDTQYQGVLLSTGIAANVAVGNFTLGISIGADNLLDQNKRYWTYEGKPFIGFTVGLNLN